MKKIYINPTINVVEMKITQHLLDGSTLSIGSGNKDTSSADARLFEDEWLDE